MKKRIKMLLLLLVCVTITASAKFVQEVELKDGTILSGYIYRQQPNKFIVFHSKMSRKDPKQKYRTRDKDYSIQWSEVKCIRRASSDEAWCLDKVTLLDNTVYVGSIEEQSFSLPKTITIKLKESGTTVKVKYSEVRMMEKVTDGVDHDLWFDRKYTNQIRLVDKSSREGLIVKQYRGHRTEDSYIELLHESGYKERIYLPDIVEYVIQPK
ncbi:MAG: hypothetical protein ACI4AH_00720 [Muribaculaceae bacterium]